MKPIRIEADESVRCLLSTLERTDVSPEVTHTDPDGIDYGWVMQMTFIITILLGVPFIALLSISVSLPTWTDRATFVVQVGAPIWFLTAISVYFYARWVQSEP